jgi:UMF1 family MFS transporter
LKKNKKIRFFYYLFDWANSPYSTVIITFIFSSYFVNVIAENKVVGTSSWGWAIAFSGFFVAVLGPIFGQIADKKKDISKNIIVLSTIIVSFGSCMLWFAKPINNFFLYTLIIIFITNTFFEFSQIFYNSKLLDFKKDISLGKFSGTAWGVGYLGGILCLGIILTLFVLPENNLLNLNKENYEHIRFCGVIVGIWYLLFSIPFLKNYNNKQITSKKVHLKELIPLLISTLKEKNKFKFLLSRMLYTDGLITLFSFGGIYASGTFGFTFNEIIFFGIALNISAALGSYFLGYLEDIIGIKKILTYSLSALTAIAFLILLIESKTIFWILGISLGFFIGSIQSSSRTALVKISDSGNLNKMFGLYAVSGKVTNFLGPMLVAIFTSLFESQRAGMGSILIFLILGLLILRRTKI